MCSRLWSHEQHGSSSNTSNKSLLMTLLKLTLLFWGFLNIIVV